MVELRRDTSWRNEETSAPIHGPSRPRGEMFDMAIGAPLTARSNLFHGPMAPLMKQPDNITSTRLEPNRQRRPILLEDEEDEPEPSAMEHMVTAINNFPHIVQGDATNTRKLNTQVPNFRGTRDKFHEFKHFFLNHFQPHQNLITEEHEVQYLQSFLPDEATDFSQTLRITPKTTLKDVLGKYRREFAKVDFKEVSKIKWDQLVYEPTNKFLRLPKDSKVDDYTSVWRPSRRVRGNAFFWKTASTDTTRTLDSRQIRGEH